MDRNLTVADYGIMSRLTRELCYRTNLKQIYIVPSEVVGFEAWEKAAQGEYEDYNEKLGEAGSVILWRELQKLFSMDAAHETRRDFRIAVAGGQTTYGMVESMKTTYVADEKFNSRRPDEKSKVVVCPLVLGAVPRHRYSAGTVADILSHKILVQPDPGDPNVPRAPHVRYAKLESIEVWNPKGVGYSVSLDPSIVRTRDQIDTSRRLHDKQTLGEFFDFDYVLLGIGRWNEMVKESNIYAHIETLYDGHAPDNLCGDICSRLFNGEGTEIDDHKQDQFVAISFPILRVLVRRGTPVVAIAGGADKVRAIRTILEGNMSEPLISGIITDELTATCLCRALKAAGKKRVQVRGQRGQSSAGPPKRSTGKP